MRWLLLVTLVACGGEGKCPEGRVCTPTFPDAALPDGAANVCAPSGTCQNGPACGIACCNFGERCVAGRCLCGDKECVTGDSCVTGGPLGAGGTCGVICCGVSGPCPI